MSRLKLLVIVAAASVAALVVADRLVETISFERFRPRIEERLSEAIGLEVKLQGDLHLELLPSPRVEVNQLTVANLPGRPSPFLAQIGTLDLDFTAWRLLFRILEIEALEFENVEIRIEPDAEGDFDLLDRLSLEDEDADQKEFALRIGRVSGENVRLFYRAAEDAHVMTLQVESLLLEAEDLDGPLSLEAVGEFEGGAFDVTGRFGSLDELLEPTQPYPLALRGQVLEAEIEVKGTLLKPSEFRGVDLAVFARLPDLAGFYRGQDQRVPALGPLTVSGRLRDPNGTLGADEIKIASVRNDPVSAEISGSVQDLRGFLGVDLTLRARAKDLSFVEELAELPLSELGPLSLDVRVSDRDGSLGLEGKLRGTARQEQLTVEVSGGYDDLHHRDELDLRLEVRARDLALIGQILALELELPPIGPLSAKARLRDHTYAFGIDEIAINLGRSNETWAKVEGSIRNLVDIKGIQLSGAFGAADLRHARPYLDYDPPDLGPISGSFEISDQDGTLGIENFELHGGRKDLFEIELSGEFDDVREIDEIELDVKLDAKDLSLLGDLVGAKLPAITPAASLARVRGSDEKLVSRGSIRLDKTVIEGEWTASFAPGSRPSLTARIRSPHIHLDDIGIEPREMPPGVARPVKAAVKSKDWSSSDPLPFEQLRSLDLDIQLQADRVSGRAGLDVRDARISLLLDDGKLTIPEAGGRYEAGTLRAQLLIDASTPVPLVAVKGYAVGVDLTRVLSQLEEQPETAGVIDASIDLSSQGHTADELLSELAGQLALMGREGSFSSEFARAFLINFVSVSLPSISRPTESPVHCMLFTFELEQGVASVQTLFLQADQADVAGTGSIDLAGNAYDLTLVPRPRDPGLLAMAATVHVTGPLADPVFRPRKRSLATSLGRGLLTNVLRVVTVWPSRQSSDREDPCASALATPAWATAPDATSSH